LRKHERGKNAAERRVKIRKLTRRSRFSHLGDNCRLGACPSPPAPSYARFLRRNNINAGAISTTAVGNGNGIVIESVAALGTGTFIGNIVNSGTISAAAAGIDIISVGGALFSGGISNRGAITAQQTGIVVRNVGLSGFSGGLINSATVTARRDGIFFDYFAGGSSSIVVSTGFAGGGITNTAKIVAGSTGIFFGATELLLSEESLLSLLASFGGLAHGSLRRGGRDGLLLRRLLSRQLPRGQAEEQQSSHEHPLISSRGTGPRQASQCMS